MLSSIWQLPRAPGVYALCGGLPPQSQVVFVGVAESLLDRVAQQLVVREASFVRETSQLALQSAQLSELRWWEHSSFADHDALRAAEFVASDLLDPILRSRRPIGAGVAKFVEDEAFRATMKALFSGAASGIVALPSLERVNHRLQEVTELLSKIAGSKTGGGVEPADRHGGA